MKNTTRIIVGLMGAAVIAAAVHRHREQQAEQERIAIMRTRHEVEMDRLRRQREADREDRNVEIIADKLDDINRSLRHSDRR